MSPLSPARRRLALFEARQLYSAEEVRAKIGGRTHIVTIWKWVRAGKLPKPLHIGANTSRFLGADLNAFLLKD